VTIEAMASGIAPVAAKVGGAAGIIKEGESGIFARPHDAVDMARQVEFLLDHPKERNRLSEGALRCAKSYRWEHILDKLFQSYDEVIYEYRHNEQRYAA
jgi:glycosyltransferase involved in cell wall biosynthesis